MTATASARSTPAPASSRKGQRIHRLKTSPEHGERAHSPRGQQLVYQDLSTGTLAPMLTQKMPKEIREKFARPQVGTRRSPRPRRAFASLKVRPHQLLQFPNGGVATVSARGDLPFALK